MLCAAWAGALSAVQSEASQEGGCQVWEGDGYVDYYGKLHGQVRCVGTLAGRRVSLCMRVTHAPSDV